MAFVFFMTLTPTPQPDRLSLSPRDPLGGDMVCAMTLVREEA